MAKVIDFQSVVTKQPKVRYMITIDEDEIPAYAARELKTGVITIMITARTPKEAGILRKEGTAIAKQSQQATARGGKVQ